MTSKGVQTDQIESASIDVFGDLTKSFSGGEESSPRLGDSSLASHDSVTVMGTGWTRGLCSGQAAASWGPAMGPDRPGAGMGRDVFPVKLHPFRPAPSPSLLHMQERTQQLWCSMSGKCESPCVWHVFSDMK